MNLIFDHITQHHQIDSLEEVFAAQSGSSSAAGGRKAGTGAGQAGGKACRAGSTAKAAAAGKARRQPEPQRKRERRVVDTSAVTVNTARFDDHVDDLVSERVQNFQGGQAALQRKKW